MMKRLISLFLVLLLICALNLHAFADEENEYNWEDAQAFVGSKILSEGNYWSIDEVDATIWLPGIFTPAELTEEDKADGTIAFYTTGNENNFLLLNYSSYENLTIETFYYYFLQNGYSVELISVNGIPAILQRDETRNQILLIFQTRDGKFLQLIFSPLSDEVIFAPIIASIQPNVEEDSAESVIPVNPVSTLISK